MKDLNQVLQEKESALVRVRNEVQALHAVILLLAEDRDWEEHGLAPPPSNWLTRVKATGSR